MDEQNQQQVPGAQVQAPQWQYTSGQLEQPQTPSEITPQANADEDGAVSWSASEFVSHEKNGSWFAMLIAGSVILGIIIFIATREWFSLVAIAILAVAVGVFANLRPRVLTYSVAPDGITVGEKHFMYEEFRSFSVNDEGQMPSIQLLPQKRFMVPITMYLDPAQDELIVDTLGDYLPFEEHKRDWADKLSNRFRF